MDAGLLRVGQHLGQGAAGVVRVLGVGVEDAAVVGQAGTGRDLDPPRLELLDVRMYGRESFQSETFEIGVVGGGGSAEKPADARSATASAKTRRPTNVLIRDSELLYSPVYRA